MDPTVSWGLSLVVEVMVPLSKITFLMVAFSVIANIPRAALNESPPLNDSSIVMLDMI